MDLISTRHKIGRRALSLLLSFVMASSMVLPAMGMTIAVVTTENAPHAGELVSDDGLVTIAYGADAGIPEGAAISVAEVTDSERYYAAAEGMLGDGKKAVYSRFFDIDIVSESGENVSLLAPVEVKINIADAPVENTTGVSVFHFADEAETIEEDGEIPLAAPEMSLKGLRSKSAVLTMGEGEVDEALPSDETIDPESVVDAANIEEVLVTENTGETVSFLANGFSVYGVIYTVDFTYEVGGKEFAYSITGGSGIALSELLPVLHVITDDPVTSYDEVAFFVEQIENVSFSDPSLVWVGKVDSDTTFGQLKEENNLTCEYSAILTEDQIAENDAKSISSGDWALISLASFDSDEKLIVSLLTGESFSVSVKDAKGTVWNGAADTRAEGITMNLYDYGPDSLDNVHNAYDDAQYNSNGYSSSGINQYSDLKFFSHGTEGTTINSFTGSMPNEYAAQGIVQPKLIKGYPALQSDHNNQSLAYLFDDSSRSGKTSYENVNKLMWSDGAGGYIYNSDERYAYFNTNSIQNPDNDFTVYTGTYLEEGADQTTPFKIGFFPFNDYDDSYHCIHGKNFNWGKADCRHQGHYNHHFGMTMTGTFQIDKNKSMEFEFSGDDDMWVFVDDVLVLDIGGIHNPIKGQINFNNGNVSVTRPGTGLDARRAVDNQTIAPTTIADAYARAGKTWDGSNGSYHEIKVFYLERGGMYSNLSLEIDLPFVPSGEVSFDKKDGLREEVPGAKFQLYTNPECTAEFSFKSEKCIIESDENGKVTFSGVPAGTFYMKEISAPEGYKVNDTIYEVVFKDKNYPEQGDSYITTIDGNTHLTEIVNGFNAIEVGVEKKWLDEDGNQILTSEGAEYTATFKLNRLKSWTEVKEFTPLPTSKLTIGYYGYVYYRQRDIYTKTDTTYEFAANTTVKIPYEYFDRYNDRYDEKSYKEGTDGAWNELDWDGYVEVTMPNEGEELVVYFYDGWRANGYYYYNRDRACTVGTPSGISNDNISHEPQLIPHTDEVDTEFTCDDLTLTAPVITGTFKSGLYTGTDDADKFPLEETINGVKYSYKYYITEPPIEGYTTTGGGHYSSDEDFTETFSNKKIRNIEIDITEQPKHNKTLKENYAKNTDGSYILDDDGNKKWDGTYTLSLDVTGKAASSEVTTVSKADLILVLDMSSSMRERAGSGTRYSTEIEAVRGLATELYKFNTKESPDTVAISLISFGNHAVGPQTIQATDFTTFNTALNTIEMPPEGKITEGGQGTNWEAALAKAGTVPVRNGAVGIVVFISDGKPTLRDTPDKPHSFEEFYYRTVGAYGPGTDVAEGLFASNQELFDSLVQKCYDNAKDEAKSLVDGGKELYSIAIFQSIPIMESLVKYAYSGSDTGECPDGHYKTTSSAQGIADVMSFISQTASKEIQFRKVTINDPLTVATKTTASVTGKPVDFKYYKVTTDNDGNETATEWVGGPKATYSGNGIGGTIDWNISAKTDDGGNPLANPLLNGALENDVTYRLSFTVWPNQDAYDAVLKLNEAHNDEEKIRRILEEYPDIAQFIVKDATSGVYRIHSNGDAAVRYTPYTIKDGGEPIPGEEKILEYPRPTMETMQYVMSVAKVWNDSIYSANRLKKVKFEIYEDSKLYTTIELNESDASTSDSHRWERKNIPVSPAIQSDVIAKDVKLNEGHVYTIKEFIFFQDEWKEAGQGYHYEFNPERVTPILLNGDLTYEGDTNGDAALSGVNDVRASVTITKKIVDDNGEEVATGLPDGDFTFKITLIAPNGKELKRPDSDETEELEHIWYKVLDDSGNEVGEATIIYSGETFTLKAGHSIRLINVPVGTKYKIEEVGTVAGYALDSYEYTYKDAKHQNLSSQDPEEDGMYKAAANTWHYVTIKNKEGAEISFTKIWRDAAGSASVAWPEGKAITVTIHEDNAVYARYTIDQEGLTAGTIVPDEDTKQEYTEGTKQNLIVVTAAQSGYFFRLSGLSNEKTYFISESQVEGYQSPKYYRNVNEDLVQATGAVQIEDGGIIYNDRIGVELPSTGGPGTAAFIFAGITLALTSGAVLMHRSSHRKEE